MEAVGNDGHSVLALAAYANHAPAVAAILEVDASMLTWQCMAGTAWHHLRDVVIVVIGPTTMRDDCEH